MVSIGPGNNLNNPQPKTTKTNSTQEMPAGYIPKNKSNPENPFPYPSAKYSFYEYHMSGCNAKCGSSEYETLRNAVIRWANEKYPEQANVSPIKDDKNLGQKDTSANKVNFIDAAQMKSDLIRNTITKRTVE